MLNWLVLFFLAILPFHLQAKQNWYLGACAVIEDADFLHEWIEYHRLIGVQHFYLYSNNCTGPYKEILEPYLKKGYVELYEWPIEKFETAQMAGAFDDAIKQAKGKCCWLALIEPDEYIVPMFHSNLREFLRDYQKYSGIVINWQMYGTSWVRDIPESELLIQHLTLKFPTGHLENQHVRSIVKPVDVKTCTCPHRCIFKDGCASVDPDEVPHWGGHGALNPRIPIQKIRINKYYYGPENYWSAVKKTHREKRLGRQLGEEEVKTHINLSNSWYDPAILRFGPLLKKRMERIKNGKTI